MAKPYSNYNLRYVYVTHKVRKAFKPRSKQMAAKSRRVSTFIQDFGEKY